MSRRVIEPILITDRERQWNAHEIDVEILARWMDSVFVIPGTGIRFGLDALVGLIPGLGDTLTSVVSLYILKVASLRGLPRVLLPRMPLTLSLHYLLDPIPTS